MPSFAMSVYTYTGLILCFVCLICSFKEYRPSTCRHKLNAKFDPSSSNDKFEKARNYLRMKQILKKENSPNSTTNSENNIGYQKFLGKGTLDQRLQAIVSYKRSSVYTTTDDDNVLSPQEEEELFESMDSDSDDIMIESNDEDAIYESLVLKIIEQNKLSEAKRNFMLDKAERKDLVLSDTSKSPAMSNVTNEINCTEDSNDFYTPARSTWGVFQRPRDISRAYGGGRSISKEEMDAMDYEAELREKIKIGETQQYLSQGMKIEKENESKIKDAIDRSRNFMIMGNRNSAVEVLENVQSFLSWQSDLGGDALLELGMALETVNRTDDARKIYGKLATTSWSQKIKRNSLQLLQGLDITRQIKKDLDVLRKPSMDMTNMYIVSSAIKEGLRNEWDEYKKKDPNIISPWYDDKVATDSTIKISSFRDAYNLLITSLNPLNRISSENIARAFRRMYISPTIEQSLFLKAKGLLQENNNFNTLESKINFSANSRISNTDDSPFKNIMDSYNGDNTIDYVLGSNVEKPNALPSSLNELYYKQLNGTWNIMVSIVDAAPYVSKRYEIGDIRRVISISDNIYQETNSVLWGFSSASRSYPMEYDVQRNEITLSSNKLLQSGTICNYLSYLQLLRNTSFSCAVAR